MARTYFSKATHALIGYDAPYEDGRPGGAGVVQWHDNELDAWRDAKEINAAGGSVRVVPAPEGEIQEKEWNEVQSLIGLLTEGG